MAYLTNCPLCDRERVSSGSISCPRCRHNIAAELHQREAANINTEKEILHMNLEKLKRKAAGAAIKTLVKTSDIAGNLAGKIENMKMTIQNVEQE